MKLHPIGRFDNSAKVYKYITAVPLAAAMGAEIRNVQIGRLTDAQFLEIEDALYRHKMIFLRWQPKTFAVWDNRICIHQAFNDYDGFRREMYRTTVCGEVPK